MLDVLNVKPEDPSEQSPAGNTQGHLIYMLRRITTWDNTQKAHRWIGYAQGLAVMLGLITLEQCKEINLAA